MDEKKGEFKATGASKSGVHVACRRCAGDEQTA